MNEVKKPKAAVTGGTSGIGAKVVERLVRDGFEVTNFDINEPDSNLGKWVETDFSNTTSIESVVSSVDDSFEVLVNNAGLPPREGLSEKILLVNFLGFRIFYEGMLGKLLPGASIVNTASRAGGMWRENINQIKELLALDTSEQVSKFVVDQNIGPARAYCLSKEAVIVYTFLQTEKLIVMDMRMNCVSPGGVNTNILQDFVNTFGERSKANLERTKRPTEPGEVADTIAFLASAESKWIKGTEIFVDGGAGAMTTADQLNS